MPEIIQPEKINKIIIFRTDRIGEVLLSTVCIDVLRKHFSKSYMVFATSDYAKDIVLGRDDVDEVFIFDTIVNADLRKCDICDHMCAICDYLRFKIDSIIKLLKLIFYLRKKKFDLAAVLNPHKILHLACFLSGIRYRLGYDRKFGFALNYKIEDKKSEGKKHEIEYNLDLLKAIGLNAEPIAPHLEIPVQDYDYVDRVIAQSGLSDAKPTIAIHPGSSNPQKRWSSENFILLVKNIKNQFDCNTALLGDAQDRQVNLEILSKIEQPVLDFTGAFTIKQLVAFFKKCRIFIGNDAGPMHIAAAAGIPVIALFGNASNPVRWRPWGDEHVVLYKDDINKITVDEVTETLKKFL